ncbi:CCR4-NOT transcription complex subunit 7 [Phytophthora cinnamomi]|uniref:CCR4-NOT transcription complex subunit 7 n=1 Tax=Phytophthora cinnamomi TaxID=4785 RepID=UPI00355A3DFC|nr:CCR4-NOT transcription complex subunit 7 [Phytophthora cinnamomi]
MADSDGDDSGYELSLSAPAARRRETITRQLQREILREMAADKPQDRGQERDEHERKTEEDDPEAVRRRTLSPSKAAQLLQGMASVSRRDTVSPHALKAVLEPQQDGSEQVEQVEQASESGRTENEELLGSPPASARKTKQRSPSPGLERRKSASSDSFTDCMFAPNLLEQDAASRATLDPAEAASVVAALQKEVRSLGSSTLEMEDTDSDSDNQKAAAAAAQLKQSKIKAPTPLSELVNRKKTPPSTKQSKNSLASATEGKKSKPPSPAKEAKSKKTPSPAKEAKRNSPHPAKEIKDGKSPSPAKESNRISPDQPKKPMRKKSPTPTKSNSDRRATVDPSDVLMMLEDDSQQEDGRRQTIDENGLLELANALESPSTGSKGSARKQSEEVSRKRANDSDVHAGSPEKRARSNSDNNRDQTMESMEIDSPVHAKETSPSTRQAASSNNQTQEELPSFGIAKASLVSPPPTGTRARTPLKGILSARKGKRNVLQTTPTKSVNFGPSQGAEFNHGSPSTSMTPMLAKDASRRYPSEPPASSEEEPDDAETSLNSSILDEADSFDEEEEEERKESIPPKVTQVKKSGFDLLGSRRNSLMASKLMFKSLTDSFPPKTSQRKSIWYPEKRRNISLVFVGGFTRVLCGSKDEHRFSGSVQWAVRSQAQPRQVIYCGKGLRRSGEWYNMSKEDVKLFCAAGL